MSTSRGEASEKDSFVQFGKGELASNAREYLDRVQQLWPPGIESVSPELLHFVESAVAEFPQSSSIWCQLGDLLKLGAKSTVGVGTALECYKKALKLDPLCGEAYEEIGFLYDVMDEPDCEIAFELALRCDGGLESYLALARKRAERGDLGGANELLVEAAEWFKVAGERIAELQTEIGEGVG